MRESVSARGPIRFAAFEVDPRAGEIRKHGVRIRLQDQPFRVLRILLERPGELITREELQNQIWPSDTFVDFDRGLNNAVKKLREALADSAEQPRYIETLPKRGYRFIAALEPPTNGVDGSGSRPPAEVAERIDSGFSQGPFFRRHWSRRALWISVGVSPLLLLGVAAGKLRDHLVDKPATPIRAIAVLPLQNLSNDPNQEYFADGMTDAVITGLAQIGSLKVISRTSTAQYKKTGKTAPEIARELKVEGVVEGTVQRSGDRVRITFQLVDGPADRHIWANSYDRDLRDVLLLEQEVASAIAREIRAQVTPQVRIRLEQSRPVNPQAMEAYLRGVYHLGRIGQGQGFEDYKMAVENLRLAVREDPNFAMAYVWLGDAYEESFGLPPSKMMPLQKVAEEKALSLDPQLAQAHRILGTNHLYYGWDWPATEKELRQAIELEPSSAVIRGKFSEYLIVMGRFDEAVRESEQAQELDPAQEYVAETYSHLRWYDRAIEAARAFLAFHPNDGFSHWELYEVYALQGKPRESIEELELTWKLFGFEEVASAIHGAYRNGGFVAAMRESGEQTARLHDREILALPCEAAKFYVFAGDNERALRWLQIALEERNGELIWLNRKQVWDPLRSNPRFEEIVRRVGLPQ